MAVCDFALRLNLFCAGIAVCLRDAFLGHYVTYNGNREKDGGNVVAVVECIPAAQYNLLVCSDISVIR